MSKKLASNKIPFSVLLGSTLNAIIKGEAEAAKTSVDFIREVGFDSSKSSKKLDMGKMRMIHFSYDLINESGTLQKMKLKLPLLSIVPIPLLTIDSAEIDMDIKIESVQGDNLKSYSPSNLVHHKDTKSPVLLTSIDNNPKSPNNKTGNSIMNVKIRLKSEGFPPGLSRMLNLADFAINLEEEESKSNHHSKT